MTDSYTQLRTSQSEKFSWHSQNYKLQGFAPKILFNTRGHLTLSMEQNADAQPSWHHSPGTSTLHPQLLGLSKEQLKTSGNYVLLATMWFCLFPT